MADVIAVLNAGSSSLKFSLFEIRGEALELLVSGQLDELADAEATRRLVGNLRERLAGHTLAGHTLAGHTLAGHTLAGHTLAAVGHRVVHGGTKFDKPVRIDAAALAALEKLVPLAPLHQPHNLLPIRVLREDTPALLQVACFDTAFHRTQPRVARTFALPRAVSAAGVQRYGFHGLSYESIAGALREIDAAAARGRTVVAHLGNGASMCAMSDGASVATTMGFTALDGLMMGTRAGTLDPGVLLHLLDARNMDVRAIERLLYHESGLLGVSGLSSDMRALLASDDPDAVFAVELFCYRVSRELGSLVAALGGLDALVFTGGIGERAAPVRAAIVRQAAWLGLELDAAANDAHRSCITTAGSRIPAYVLPTDEARMIARHTLRILREG